jgi:prepilin-type N-terminal cleavage/methylation domain-containing protein
MARSKQPRAFTLIEVLIVVAVIGIIAAILIPNLLDALQKANQRRTMANMRNLGTAWYSWLTDVASVSAAGANAFDWSLLDRDITAEGLLTTLYLNPTMFYTRHVPKDDGWGNEFDYAWSGNPSSQQVIGMRSFGRDGLEGPGYKNPYSVGPFVSTAYDEDIVWSDGVFIRYPQGSFTH